MPVLSKRIVLDCFYLLIFYFEKFSTDVCRLPCAVNVNLNLSNCANCYSETTLLKYADPQRQRKAKSLRESKKQTTGASSATIKH